MKELAIFDLDGTLLNTIADLGMATNHALQKCGFPMHEISAYPMFVGNGVMRLLERALPEDARNQENISRLRGFFTDFYDLHNADNTQPYPGIEDLLEELSRHGVRLAVASNKYQKAVEKLILHYFPNVDWAAIEGQKEGCPVKPDPSVVFEILSKSPAPKAGVIYIGDSGVDIETARRACVESVGVTWGFRPEKELIEFNADHIVNSPAEIIHIAIG